MCDWTFFGEVFSWRILCKLWVFLATLPFGGLFLLRRLNEFGFRRASRNCFRTFFGVDLPDTKDVPIKFPVKPSVHVFFDIMAKLVDTWHVPKPPRLPMHRPKHLPLVVRRRLHPRISTQTGGMVLRRASHRLGPQFSRVRQLPGYRHQLRKELRQIRNGA